MSDRIKAIIHDTRLAGDAPYTLVNATCLVSAKHSTESILNWITLKSEKYGYIDDLLIMAHGIVDAVTERGGYGLQLGKDNLTVNNVYKWCRLRQNGCVGHIYLLACAVADWDVGKVGFKSVNGNGLYMCSKLAQYSGAEVTASDTIQWYHAGLWGIFGNTIDFGKWEGNVYTWNAAGTLESVVWG